MGAVTVAASQHSKEGSYSVPNPAQLCSFSRRKIIQTRKREDLETQAIEIVGPLQGPQVPHFTHTGSADPVAFTCLDPSPGLPLHL